MFDYVRIMLNARLAKMDERGASAVEYGLLIAGIAAVTLARRQVLVQELPAVEVLARVDVRHHAE